MMNDRAPDGQARAPAAGLCSGCRHVQVVRTHRGSQFYLCRRSFEDSRYPRYPPIPVLVCAGFEREEEPPAAG